MTTRSSTGAFRKYVFPDDDARINATMGLTPYEYQAAARDHPFTGGLIDGWSKLYPAEFVGVTNDGKLREELYPFQELSPDEQIPVEAMARAALGVLEVLTDEERARASHAVDAVEWQSWSNPEFLIHDTGVRVEFVSDAARTAILGLIEAALSPEGYELVRTVMRVNGFLGEVVGLQNIMNEYSYQFSLYGTPSTTEPWGWQLFGHHVAINCAVVADRMVMTPLFLGAEPNLIDKGPYEGASAFVARIALAHHLMAALTPDQRRRATVYQQMVDPATSASAGGSAFALGSFDDRIRGRAADRCCVSGR